MEVQASCTLTAFATERPHQMFEMHAEVPSLRSQQRKEDREANRIRQPFTLKREGAEELPLNTRQAQKLRVVHVNPNLLGWLNDLSANPQPSAKRQDFPDTELDHLVLQFTRVF